jgi:formylglycine-generating enzyme required for sulfatase activity
MKRIALALSIPVFLLLACNLLGTVPAPAADLPVNTNQPVNTAMPVSTRAPVDTEVPIKTAVGENTKLPVNTEVPSPGSSPTPENDGMVQVFVPGGDFKMGSDYTTSGYPWEGPIHTVFLDPFWIDQTEVTNAMFEAFATQRGYQTDAEKTGSSAVFNLLDGSFWRVGGADWQHPLGADSSLLNLGAYPVVHVSWNDARAYCEWAGRRLPTEAEWEKAARGTDGRTFPWGNEFDGTRLNFADVNLNVRWGDNNFNDKFQFSSPVGNYPSGASPYGALDMAGNVWEWVNDWASELYYQDSPSSNPGGPDSGLYRVYRGGSWEDTSDGTRAGFRGWIDPKDTSNGRGFRCVRTP